MNRFIKIAATGIALMSATSAFAVDVQETIIMMHHVSLKMEGKMVQADIVKMNGHMYVMIPADNLPDPLHQQILKYMQ
jgi:hypothetical protein